MGLNILKKVKQAGITEIIQSGTTLIDEIFTNKEEAGKIKIEYVKQALADRDSARDLYSKDSSLQKIYALVFLVSYILLTGAMLYIVISISKNNIHLEEWVIAFISTVWGGMSTKVGTITDFFFGSSQSSKDKNDLFKKK